MLYVKLREEIQEHFKAGFCYGLVKVLLLTPAQVAGCGLFIKCAIIPEKKLILNSIVCASWA